MRRESRGAWKEVDMGGVLDVNLCLIRLLGSTIVRPTVNYCSNLFIFSQVCSLFIFTFNSQWFLGYTKGFMTSLIAMLGGKKSMAGFGRKNTGPKGCYANVDFYWIQPHTIHV